MLGLPALAFAPSDSVHIGREPVRTYHFHDERQHGLRRGVAWQRFTRDSAPGWQVRFDEVTGTPLRAWGAGIDLGPVATEAQVQAAVLQLLSQHEDLLGVPVSSLRLGQARLDASTDSWILRFDQVAPGSNQATGGNLAPFEFFASHGQPVVWRGAVQARVRYGKLVMLGAQTYPGVDRLDTTPRLTATQAFDVAIGQGPHPDAVHDIDGATLVVLPLDGADGLDLRLAWMVRTETGSDPDYGDPRGQWVSFVDAQDGSLLNVFNQVRYMAAVYGEHDTRTVNGDTSVSPMVYLNVQGSGSSDQTGLDGIFDAVGAYSANLNGDHFRVRNSGGSDASASWSSGDFTWTTTDADIAEIDTWVFLHEIREWSLEYAPDIELPDQKLTSTVNLNDVCNAYYDGDVNFFRAGSGCNNTGRIRDVNHHEWGHGFHYYAAYTSWVDGSIGEGSSDAVAFLQSNDPIIAPYFMSSGSGIRRADTNYVYPDDITGGVHQDGLIFAGAFWDFWKLLEADAGVEPAFAITSELLTNTLKQNPEIATSYDDAVAADDDNGDLSDGTPNQCLLIEAFSQHGLGPSGGSGLLGLTMETVDNQAALAEQYPLDADLLNYAEACLSAEPEAARVVYSTDDGASWDSAPLSTEDGLIAGAIPALDSTPGIVQYYVEVDYSDGAGGGGSVAVPQGRTINPFTFIVGDLEQIYCQDFEEDDGGYTHSLVAGTDQEGADDWSWGRPGGLSEDPAIAFSGSRVWGNDLGGGNYNGAYQANKFNRLQSIPIDVAGYDTVVVQYRRWLNVEDSTYDQARVTANDAVIWTNHGSSAADEHTQDRQWALHSLAVPADAIGEDGSLVLGWEIESDGGLEFGGWNIDDVCVYGVAGADDGGLDSGDVAEGEDGGSGATPAQGDGELKACGCASTGQAAGGALALVGLLGLVARRRREDG